MAGVQLRIIGGDPLSTFLRAASERPFSWALQHDCLMFLADRIKAARGKDPAERWRGRYRTMAEAMRIVKEAGGMVAHVERCVAPLGIKRTDSPQYGDIAIVRGPEGESGAIVLGETTASLLAMGLIYRKVEDTPIIAAWRI